jgi:hypothetical protein
MPHGKFQIDADGVTHSEDGYLVIPPALHPSGVVYEFIANGAIGVLPAKGSGTLPRATPLVSGNLRLLGANAARPRDREPEPRHDPAVLLEELV